MGCAGVPLDNVIVKIFDPSSQEEVPLGQEGEICVSGNSVMEGYRNNPEANEEVFFMHHGLFLSLLYSLSILCSFYSSPVIYNC